jgi:hypothetical protein
MNGDTGYYLGGRGIRKLESSITYTATQLILRAINLYLYIEQSTHEILLLSCYCISPAHLCYNLL